MFLQKIRKTKKITWGWVNNYKMLIFVRIKMLISFTHISDNTDPFTMRNGSLKQQQKKQNSDEWKLWSIKYNHIKHVKLSYVSNIHFNRTWM